MSETAAGTTSPCAGSVVTSHDMPSPSTSPTALATTDEPLRQRVGPTRLRARARGVATLAGRVPELYVAALGTLQVRSCVYSPLFSAFGPEPDRAAHGDRPHQGARHHPGALPAEGDARFSTGCPSSNSSSSSGSTRTMSVPSFRRSDMGPEVMSFGVFIGEGHDHSTSRRPTRRRRRSCTSRAARRARRRVRPRARGGRRAPRDRPSSCSICTPATSTGAPPTRAG